MSIVRNNNNNGMTFFHILTTVCVILSKYNDNVWHYLIFAFGGCTGSAVPTNHILVASILLACQQSQLAFSHILFNCFCAYILTGVMGTVSLDQLVQYLICVIEKGRHWACLSEIAEILWLDVVELWNTFLLNRQNCHVVTENINKNNIIALDDDIFVDDIDSAIDRQVIEQKHIYPKTTLSDDYLVVPNFV